jgi:hypothetical protein
MNMSYCRFQNTLGDLTECKEVLEGIGLGAEESLSPEELRAAIQLVMTCTDILQNLSEVTGIDIEDLCDDANHDVRKAVEMLNEKGGVE